MNKMKSTVLRGAILFCIGFFLTSGNIFAIAQEYTISGQVTEMGRGVDGIAIAVFNGETTQYIYTSGGGYYSIILYGGWTGTITPQDPCFNFSPTTVSIGPLSADTVQDFIATRNTITLSGVVSDGPPNWAGETLLNGISGVTIILSSGQTMTTGPNGNYSFSVPCGWYGSVTTLKAGWNFTPYSYVFEEPMSEDLDSLNFIGTESETTFTVSGRIADSSGRVPMNGVSVEFFDGISLQSVVTTGDGEYLLELPYAWAGTVAPHLDGFGFNPVQAAIGPLTSNVTQNFTAESFLITVSGTVMDKTANPIPGVTLSLSTGATTNSSATGSYAIEVPYDWSGNLTASLGGWTFTPLRRSFTHVKTDHPDQHFVGRELPDQFVISGTVTLGGDALAGVELQGLPGNPSSDGSGFYSVNVNEGWSGTVTPFMAGYVFSPVSRVYPNVSADQINQNYSAVENTPPTVEIKSPPGGSFVSGEVPIRIEASDADGISRVELYIDGVLMAEFPHLMRIGALNSIPDRNDSPKIHDGHIQRDGVGNLYSVHEQRNGWTRLQKRNAEGMERTLMEGRVRIDYWSVEPDGRVTVAGSDRDSGETWVRHIGRHAVHPIPGAGRLDIQWRRDNEGLDRQELIPVSAVFTCNYLWDTSVLAAGSHNLRAVAFDTRGASSAHAIVLNVSSLGMEMNLEWIQEKAWIITRNFIRITTNVDNPASIPVDRYVVQRKMGAGAFLSIREITAGEITGGTFTMVDESVEWHNVYTYRVLAMDSNGLVVGATMEKTI